jgi:hypothetical protein
VKVVQDDQHVVQTASPQGSLREVPSRIHETDFRRFHQAEAAAPPMRNGGYPGINNR